MTSLAGLTWSVAARWGDGSRPAETGGLKLVTPAKAGVHLCAGVTRRALQRQEG